jgi:hypothetical protein
VASAQLGQSSTLSSLCSRTSALCSTSVEQLETAQPRSHPAATRDSTHVYRTKVKPDPHPIQSTIASPIYSSLNKSRWTAACFALKTCNAVLCHEQEAQKTKLPVVGDRSHPPAQSPATRASKYQRKGGIFEAAEFHNCEGMNGRLAWHCSNKTRRTMAAHK